MTSVRDEHKNKIKHEAYSNLERIMEEQEERLGIIHKDKPNLAFEVSNYDERFFAVYTPENDTINFNSKSLTCETDLIIYQFINWLEGNEVENYRIVLEHELGHFYVDKLNESLGKGNWPIFPDSKDRAGIIGLRIISEGIAEYFERTHTQQLDLFTDSEWPNNLESYDATDLPKFKWLIYGGGYHLVKPIIDSYGKNGIKYLMLNPPKNDEITNLEKYQNKILQELKENKLGP
ncbi:MAG: hypothetical protein Q8Q01_02660 [archaeon]|nr:hypothetical protein [archaeon]